MFERNLKKMQKKDPSMTEEELLRRVIESWDEVKVKVEYFS